MQIILCIGRVEARKNLKLLFHGFAKTEPAIRANAKIVVVGPLGWRGSQVIKYGMQLLGASNLEWVGKIDDYHLARLIKNASVLVHPSFDEGFGFPPLEAMVAGCPVIISDAPALVEVAGNAAIVVGRNDTIAMKMALETLLMDEAVRSQLVELGVKRSLNYTWSRCASNTMAVYKAAARPGNKQ